MNLKKQGIFVLKLDITDEKSITKTVDTIIDEQGRIDILVNSAGYGAYGAVEDVPLSEAKYQFGVNVFGLVRIIQFILPYICVSKGMERYILQWELGYEATKRALKKTCENLNVEYIDMYLIHFAVPGYLEAWRAMEELYSEGKIKVIGVANFKIQHLEELMKHSKITPMVNQIETHPEFPQNDLHDYLIKHKILHAAWAPLGQRNKDLLKNKVLEEIVSYHEKTVAQVILRWHTQRGIIIIPKSSNPKQIKENIQLFDFELSSEEMKRISKLNTGKRYSHSPTGYMINPLYNKLIKIFLK